MIPSLIAIVVIDWFAASCLVCAAFTSIRYQSPTVARKNP